MIEHLEEIRDELNLNIEKLRERVNTGDIEFKVTEIPAQTIYKGPSTHQPSTFARSI